MCYNHCYSNHADLSLQQVTSGPLLEADSREMNEKCCNLLVSPTSVPKSLGAITGQQVPHIRVHAGTSRSSSHQRATGPGSEMVTADVEPGSTMLLPALSLRRQVLTNGKHHGTFTMPRSSWEQGSSLPVPPGNSITARLNGTQIGIKGNELKQKCSHEHSFYTYCIYDKFCEKGATLTSFSINDQ